MPSTLSGTHNKMERPSNGPLRSCFADSLWGKTFWHFSFRSGNRHLRYPSWNHLQRLVTRMWTSLHRESWTHNKVRTKGKNAPPLLSEFAPSPPPPPIKRKKKLCAGFVVFLEICEHFQKNNKSLWKIQNQIKEQRHFVCDLYFFWKLCDNFQKNYKSPVFF